MKGHFSIELFFYIVLVAWYDFLQFTI
jgi:hypothetical protein